MTAPVIAPVMQQLVTALADLPALTSIETSAPRCHADCELAHAALCKAAAVSQLRQLSVHFHGNASLDDMDWLQQIHKGCQLTRLEPEALRFAVSQAGPDCPRLW